MKITVLMENTSENANLYAEHGLSLFIETPHHNVIMDTGASGRTWENAAKLGIDVRKADTVIISHGHYDHAGGVLDFAAENPNARIYMRKNACGDFYHGEKYIGIDKKIMDLKNLVPVTDKTLKVDDELFIFSEISGRRLWPSGNSELTELVRGIGVQDRFSHEQCLVVSDGKKKILLSGCAHNGILNILDRYREIFHSDPDAVISGFHMMKKTDYTEYDVVKIKETADELLKLHTEFYTGHCTGENAFMILKGIMGERLHAFHVGDELCI